MFRENNSARIWFGVAQSQRNIANGIKATWQGAAQMWPHGAVFGELPVQKGLVPDTQSWGPGKYVLSGQRIFQQALEYIFTNSVSAIATPAVSLQRSFCLHLESVLSNKMNVRLLRREEIGAAGTGRGEKLPPPTLDRRETTLLG